MTTNLLFLAAFLSAASVPVKVFEEEFDRYPEHPDIFSEKSHIGEAPSSLKSMNFTPEKQEQLRKKPFTITENPVNFDFLFDFRFGKDSQREFTVVLLMKDPEKPNAASAPLNLTIREKGSLLTFPRSFRMLNWGRDDGPLPGFPDRYTQKARLSVREGYARLYVERQGKWYLESQGQLLKKGMILTGFNVVSKTQVTLDAFQVWKYPDDAKSPALTSEFPFAGDAEFEIAGLPYPSSFSVQLLDEDAGKTQVIFRSIGETKYTKTTRKDGQTVVERNQFLPDAGFMASAPGVRVYMRTRPNLARYTNEGNNEIAAKWDSFPSGSKTPVRIRVVRKAPDACEFWINEKMAFPLKTGKEVRKIAFDLPGGTLRVLEPRQIPASKEFLVVDPVASLNWSSLWADPATNRLAKPSVVCGVPFLSAKEYSFPLSVCRENKGSYYLECDGYLERRAFDAMPSSIHFSVPVAQYIKAYALCSVDPEATPDMTPEITARLTNYTHPNEGRGDGFSHHTVRLPAKPGDPLPPNVKIAGGTKENPLYFVEFDIDAGAIEDIIFRENNPSLDFEFLGRLYEKDNFYLSRAVKPSPTKSSVILHAATLKRTPAELRVDQGRPGALWYLNENPRMNIHVKPLEKGVWTVKTEITDLEGRKLSAFTEKVTEEKDIETVFPQKEYGWYAVRTVLEDSKGTPLVTRNSSFVLLPPDTRKAGPESPFHAWVWDSIKNVEQWGPILQRMGTRRIANGSFASEQQGAVFKLYKGQFGYFSPRRYKTEEEFKKAIEKAVADFPHCTAALIFHESGGGPFPLELIGKKTDMTPEQIEKDQQMTQMALTTASMWRKYAPKIRLLVGNSGNSLGLLARIFRQKFPREMIDAMGDENACETQPPEIASAHTAWSLAKLAEIYGYKDLKPDACYEWRVRGIRYLSPIRFASYMIRDNLIALAWNYTLVNGGGLGHWSMAYYNTVWGSGGSFTRAPLWDPQPAAAAFATQSLVLDCAKYARMIDTGSFTVYAGEFRRGGEYIYALWTARGETSASVTFEKQTSFLRTEMLGTQHNEKTSDAGTFELAVTEQPVYLTSSVPLKTVQAAKTSRTYRTEPRPEGKPDTVCAMDDASAWEAVSGVDPRIIIGGDDEKHFFEPAKFEIRSVEDEEKGKALELALEENTACPELVQETGFIRLKTPVEIPGKPHTLGVSCKGNSSWGKLMFEITDAEGEVFLSAGNGGFGCPTYDWNFIMGLNYDGWHTLAFPLTGASPVKASSPGENQWQWQRSGGTLANGIVDYPVKLTAIGFTMYRTVPVVNEMKKAGNAIRLRDFVSWSGK